MEEAAICREELARKVRFASGDLKIRTVAGVDAAYIRGIEVAAVALYSLDNLELIEVRTSIAEVRFPYVPGYLFFREGPAVLAALEKLETRPDSLIVDGHGTAHPDKAGYACLLGALLDLPTIGCAKSRLVGCYSDPGVEKGEWSPLFYGETMVGAVVRTRKNTRPVFVSPGHLIALRGAIDVVISCAPKFRIPEPLRAADATARKVARRYAEEKG